MGKQSFSVLLCSAPIELSLDKSIPGRGCTTVLGLLFPSGIANCGVLLVVCWDGRASCRWKSDRDAGGSKLCVSGCVFVPCTA